MFLSSWFKAMHHARLRWGNSARAEKRRVQRLPQAPRSGAELQERSDEASGLERGARAGISPINSKPPVLGCHDERIIEKMSCNSEPSPVLLP
jgi:hypothetical protein